MWLPSEEINKRFGKHAGSIEGPNPNAAEHERLRREFTQFATVLSDTIPEGRNASLALTALEEASMWAHKAVAND